MISLNIENRTMNLRLNCLLLLDILESGVDLGTDSML